MTRLSSRFSAACLMIAALMSAQPLYALAQEAESINAYAPISTSGYFLETAAGRNAFVGIATGTMYFEADAGVMNSGNLSCTISMEIMTPASNLDAEGKCKVLGTQGKVLFGRYECTGSLGFGCNGRFTVTGGSDEFAGATGSSEFLLRTLIAESVLSPGSTLSSGNNGIAVWRDLRVILQQPEPADEDDGEPESEGER